MHQQTIEEIVKEVGSHLSGRLLGKIFQLSPLSLAIDFYSPRKTLSAEPDSRRKGAGYLFISVEPAAPRLYLIQRRVKEMQKHDAAPSSFVQAIRSNLGAAVLVSITKDPTERVVRLDFAVEDEIGQSKNLMLVAQLTGRSANLFLLDEQGRITHTLRPPKGEGQQVGERYQPPSGVPKSAGPGRRKSERETRDSDLTDSVGDEQPLDKGAFTSLSAAADEFYLRSESAEAFAARAKTLLSKTKKELTQLAKLQRNLRKDLSAHGDSGQHRRLGDLLLANLATAQRQGNKVKLKDYYADDPADIEIEVDENTSLQEEAARYFSRYRKAKRAKEEIQKRLARIEETAARIEERRTKLERIIVSGDEDALALFEGPKTAVADKKIKRKPAEKVPGVRRYRSSDGFEILVGRAAHTNDQLTFRVARPHDWWLHAADYAGSHVVIRNHGRGEIPHRTVIEAAQLAAKFSQAGNDSKVTIHYTQRKFLSKPRGAAPGLVRMSTFRTIVVQPGENISRIVDQN
ncbi:MAG: Rqc2 family fibronectin-binding protein [Pyrinomonadaceae bacterium]